MSMSLCAPSPADANRAKINERNISLRLRLIGLFASGSDRNSSSASMDNPRFRLHHFNRQGADLQAIAAQRKFVNPGARHGHMLQAQMNIGMAKPRDAAFAGDAMLEIGAKN